MIISGDWAPGNKCIHIANTLGLVLANLEGPILHSHCSLSSALKAGPSLFSRELPNETSQFAFALANNHIMDYGLPGLEATLKLIDQRGFKACGAGKNVYDARQPIVVEDKGVQVGVIACCEAQFGVARRNSAGVAEFGPWIYRSIRDLSETVEAVIVSVHAAVEDSPWPSPYIRELYHSFIDAGAMVVHGHHAHVPQGYEAYGDGVIFYGMGNFAVDPDKWRDYPNGMWSLAAEINFSSKPMSWHPLTLEIRHQPGSELIVIEESNVEERVSRRRYLEICNHPFDSPDLFDALWQEVSLRAYYHHGARYMRFPASPQSGRRVQVRASLSMLKGALISTVAPSRSSQNDYLLWYHMISCESHRQMLTTALGVLASEIKDLRTEETRRLADEMMLWPMDVT
jgi:poly-gamma-glutamate synthesis protein (capsule biosynthesis protein)